MRSIVINSCCAFTAAVGVAAGLGGECQSPAGGLVTLYQRDPLACRVSFDTGNYGGLFQDHMVKNRQSDLFFGHYFANEFSVGVEGGRVGAIVDLGSPDDLRAQYGFQETVGGGQGFASIRLADDKLVILADYEAQTTQPLSGAEALFSELAGLAHVPIHDNHIYLLRLRDRHTPEFDRLVKLLVVQYEPGVSVTLRWQVISSSSSAS